MPLTLQDKQEALSVVLDCAPDALVPEAELASFAWDSMARVTLVAIARTRFGVRITGAELLAFKTVGDVFAALDRSTPPCAPSSI